METQAYLARMRDLTSVATSDRRIAEIGNLLTRAGFQTTTSAAFVFEGVKFGHVLVAER